MSKGYLWGLFEYDIYKANADGSNLRNLTPNTPGYDAEATVCADDGSIIFTSTRSGDLELWRMDADGKNLAPADDRARATTAARSSRPTARRSCGARRGPQGKDLEEYKALLAQKLVKPTKMDLYVANADGTDARQVTYLPGASFAPFFFPDGKRIIFSSNYLNPRSAEFDLFAIDIDGTNLERITFAPRLRRLPGVLARRQDARVLVEPARRRAGGKGDVYRVDRHARGREGHQRVPRRLGRRAASDDGAPETAAADRFAATWRTSPPTSARAAASAPRASTTRSRLVAGRSSRASASSPGVARRVAPAVRGHDRGQARRGDRARARRQAGRRRGLRADAALGERHRRPAPIVAVGWGIVDAEAKLDDYKGKNVNGKIVLVHRFAPPDAKLEPRRRSAARRPALQGVHREAARARRR